MFRGFVLWIPNNSRFCVVSSIRSLISSYSLCAYLLSCLVWSLAFASGTAVTASADPVSSYPWQCYSLCNPTDNPQDIFDYLQDCSDIQSDGAGYGQDGQFHPNLIDWCEVHDYYMFQSYGGYQVLTCYWDFVAGDYLTATIHYPLPSAVPFADVHEFRGPPDIPYTCPGNCYYADVYRHPISWAEIYDNIYDILHAAQPWQTLIDSTPCYTNYAYIDGEPYPIGLAWRGTTDNAPINHNPWDSSPILPSLIQPISRVYMRYLITLADCYHAYQVRYAWYWHDIIAVTPSAMARFVRQYSNLDDNHNPTWCGLDVYDINYGTDVVACWYTNTVNNSLSLINAYNATTNPIAPIYRDNVWTNY